MIAAITSELDQEGVERLLRPTAPEQTVRVERNLYYPYFWLQLRYAVHTVLGKSAVRLSCLVDSRTRTGATTDPFDLERIEANERDIIAPRVDEGEAHGIAERYIGYVLRNRRRALVASTLEVLSCELVYKPFWIVTCPHARKPSLRVLVDGITGGLHPLATERP